MTITPQHAQDIETIFRMVGAKARSLGYETDWEELRRHISSELSYRGPALTNWTVSYRVNITLAAPNDREAASICDTLVAAAADNSISEHSVSWERLGVC